MSLPHPFKPGVRFLAGRYVYEVTRLSATRAYLMRVSSTEIPPHGFSTIAVHGNERTTGLYVELAYWSPMRQEHFYELPGDEDHDTLNERVASANARVQEHLDKIAKLTLQISEQKKIAWMKIITTLTGRKFSHGAEAGAAETTTTQPAHEGDER